MSYFKALTRIELDWTFLGSAKRALGTFSERVRSTRFFSIAGYQCWPVTHVTQRPLSTQAEKTADFGTPLLANCSAVKGANYLQTYEDSEPAGSRIVRQAGLHSEREKAL